MTIADQVRCSIDDYENGTKFESALLHATTAIDGTATKLFGAGQNRANYIRCLREYYWLIEPMLGGGINLDQTVFNWGRLLEKTPNPDIAELIYVAFRCTHAHGDKQPTQFDFIKCAGTGLVMFKLADGKISLPDTLIFALLSVAVFSKVNCDQKILGDYHFTLGGETFIINEWWGREDDFRAIAAKNTKQRIELVLSE
jgi:hypothetical protein